MPCWGDIAMIFIHFHTILIIFGLTINSVHPSASFCFLLFLYFRFFHYENCQKNSEKNIYKISVPEPSGPRRRAGGGPPGLQAPWWRGPPPGCAGGGGAWAPQVPSDVTL